LAYTTRRPTPDCLGTGNEAASGTVVVVGKAMVVAVVVVVVC
jgi:hypothetical protein